MGHEAEHGRLNASVLSDAIARSQTFAQYAATMPSNAEALDDTYHAVKFTEEERQAIASIGSPLTVLALVEEWCPDVIANLPIFARIEDLNPLVSLDVLYRPEHEAVATAYSSAVTGRSHIPTYVLLDVGRRELAVLIERPQAITRAVQEIGLRMKAELAERFPGVVRDDLPQDFVRARTEESLRHRRTLLDTERADIVGWLVDAAKADHPSAP
jgi:hypothetical protein